MAWAAYKLTYQALSPVLLGTHPLGFVQRTRLSAPGWTLWGAITARLTRAMLDDADGGDYEAVGRFVERNLPTSYAWILLGDQVASPHFEDGELHYGDLPAARFEARFLTSLGQTAVAPATVTAETRALHETEVLVGRDPQRDGEPVRWQIVVYVRQPWQGPANTADPTWARLLAGKAADIVDALQTLAIGADRGYGLGRLRLISQSRQDVLDDGVWPYALGWDASGRILQAHVPAGELGGDAVRGHLEAIPWRWWENEPGDRWGPGQRSQVGLFYAPGSRIEAPDWRPVVGPKGIWHGEGWRDAAANTS